jgi:hypothetical protein
MVTEYENTYNADSLFVKVIERDYPVLGGIQLPFDRMRTYEYEYNRLPDGADEQRKYRIREDGERALIAVNVSSPRREEAVELRGGDTTRYELKLFDAQGRLTREERRSKMDYSDFGMVDGTYRKTNYEYDALGREIKKTIYGIYNGEETRYTVETAYRGDTDEVVSEKLLSDGESTTRYLYEQRGDTLVRKAYRDDNTLEEIEKSLPGYTATTYYYDGTPERMNEVFTDGDRRIEVSRELIDGSLGIDSMYYDNDLISRWYRNREHSRIIYEYQYDNRGNMTRERQQGWFY